MTTSKKVSTKKSTKKSTTVSTSKLAVRASEFAGAKKLKATGKTFDKVLFSAGSVTMSTKSAKGRILAAIGKVKKADYAAILKASGLKEVMFHKHLMPAVYNNIIEYRISK